MRDPSELKGAAMREISLPDKETVGQPISSRQQTWRCFRLADDGVIYTDSKGKETVICGRLEISAIVCDKEGNSSGQLLRWTGLRGSQEWVMPMSALAGEGIEIRTRLLDGGLYLAPGKSARQLLMMYLQTTNSSEMMLCVDQSGWHDERFVLPGCVIGQHGSKEKIVLQTQPGASCLVGVSGTLDEWRENVGKFCSGNSRLIFAAACSFAGPLLRLGGAESGGVHFVGSSSIGKTTALLVGGSVIGGGGQNGFVQTWRATSNGLESVAHLHNDMALFIDELAQLDQREASQVAYLLANGKGKSRMRSDITIRKSLTWTLIFVSSGETTLSAIAEKAGQPLRGGAEIRLLNVSADAGAGLGLFENLHGFDSADAFAHRLKRSARQYYGTPFRAYLEFLVQNMDDVKKAVRSSTLEFLNKHVPSGASGEISRVAERLALIAAAGEIATSEAKITGWEEGEAEAAAARFLREWIDARGTTGGTDIESAISQVRRFIEQHGQSRFQDADQVEQEDRTVINRAGVKRKSASGETQYLIFPETFKRDVCAGFDYKQVAQALDRKGLLVRDGTRLTHNARVPGIDGTARFFCIKGALLGES